MTLDPIKLFIGRYLLFIEIGVAVAAIAVIGFQYVEIEHLKTTIATDRAAYDKQVADAAEASLKASEQNRSTEQKWAATAKEKEDAHAKELANSARIASSLRAERDGVRNTLASYSAGAGLTAETAASSCSSRAAALGRGLDTTLSAEEDLVQQLESSLADTRVLLDWARAVSSP